MKTSSSIGAKTHSDNIWYFVVCYVVFFILFIWSAGTFTTKVAETHFGHWDLKLLLTGCRYTLSSRTNRLKNSFVTREIQASGDLRYFSMFILVRFVFCSWQLLSEESSSLARLDMNNSFLSLSPPVIVQLIYPAAGKHAPSPLSTCTLYTAVVMPLLRLLINSHCRLTSLISPLASLASAEASLTINSAAAGGCLISLLLWRNVPRSQTPSVQSSTKAILTRLNYHLLWCNKDSSSLLVSADLMGWPCRDDIMPALCLLIYAQCTFIQAISFAIWVSLSYFI